jgi:hypothetical protein
MCSKDSPRGWHDPNVELPEPLTLVWLWNEGGLKVGALSSNGGGRLWTETNGRMPEWKEGRYQAELVTSKAPTHWMELPTPGDKWAGWSQVGETLPEPMDLVLTFDRVMQFVNIGCLAPFNDDGTAQWWETDGFIPSWYSEKYDSDLDVGCSPTHWCALPTPPPDRA